MLVDSHAHVAFPQFTDDRQAVLERARGAGVVRIVDVGTDLASSRLSLALAESEPCIWATVGVHPHEAATLTPVALAELRTLAAHPRVVAIGEIGLDYYRNLAPRDRQGEAFRAQLDLARELGLPVIVHDRDAHTEVLATLRAAAAEQGGRLRGVMHCFSGDWALAQSVLELGLYVGIAGPVTYPSSRSLAEVARQVPLERLLVETDCPYLAPQPRRGKRNEPAYVRYTTERVAELRSLAPAEVARVTTENACALFGLECGVLRSVR